MPLSTGAKVFLGLAGLGIGYAVYDTLADDQKRKKSEKDSRVKPKQPKANEDVVEEPGHGPGPGPFPPPPVGPGGVYVPPPPEVSRDEPVGGWEFRFQQGIASALVACQADPDVTSLAEAHACILTKLYPENRPWSGSKSDWKPWMQQARIAVQQAIAEAVIADTGSMGAPGWQFTLWLMFNRFFGECRQAVGQDNVEAITHCISTLMWPPPDYDWPPGVESPPWHHEAWKLVRDRVVARLQGPGLGTLAG